MAVLAISIGTVAPTAGADVGAGIDPIPSLDVSQQLPGVTTGDATVLGPSTATLHGSVNPNGLATTVFFEYGTAGALDLKTPRVSLEAGVDPAALAADILNLRPGTAYSYRLVAESPAGTVAGPTQQFTTAPAVSVSVGTGRAAFGLGARRVDCTIVGTPGNDVLTGTSSSDVICGLGGNDRIRGKGGRDWIVGGTGKDRVSGGRGSDRIWGNSGRDRLAGASGNDRVSGGRGSDRIWGNKGNDSLRGDGGKDRIAGGPGRDRVQADKSDRVRSAERVTRS